MNERRQVTRFMIQDNEFYEGRKRRTYIPTHSGHIQLSQQAIIRHRKCGYCTRRCTLLLLHTNRGSVLRMAHSGINFCFVASMRDIVAWCRNSNSEISIGFYCHRSNDRFYGEVKSQSDRQRTNNLTFTTIRHLKESQDMEHGTTNDMGTGFYRTFHHTKFHLFSLSTDDSINKCHRRCIDMVGKMTQNMDELGSFELCLNK